MDTHAVKTQENKSHPAINGRSGKPESGSSPFLFADNRPETVVQRKLLEMANKSSSATGANHSQVVQRETDMKKDDWSKQSAAHFMMNKQTKTAGNGDVVADLAGQNKANASIWYNTIFSGGLDPAHPDYDPNQERVLQEQQAMLKKHFLSQAVLGVQGGNQFKKGKKNNPDIQENYQPIENFKQDGVSANLATLASGGGRFNYRSADGSGDEFNNFLMGTNNLAGVRDTTSKKGGQQPTAHMGAYKRIGTHGESFKNGHITEIDKTTGGIDSTGFDIPIGGIGQDLADQKGRGVTTGYQGISKATRRGRHKGSDEKKYQTGHGFHRHATDATGQKSLTQIAFEGSGPNTDNIHGGSHGAMATVGKKLFGSTSESTLTGQDKRSNVGLPGSVGAIKSDVDQAGLDRAKEAWSSLDLLKGKAYEKQAMQRLLASTTQDERNDVIDDIISTAEFYVDDLDLLD